MPSSDLVKEQAGIGNRDEAHRAADRLKAFFAELLAGTETMNPEDVFAEKVAGALAAVDDFEGAFARVKPTALGDRVAGEAALSAAKFLDKDRARRYVARGATARDGEGPLSLSSRTSSSPRDSLAEAQARVGDFEAAEATARSIGERAPKAEDIGAFGWDWAIQAMRKIADGAPAAGQLGAKPARPPAKPIG